MALLSTHLSIQARKLGIVKPLLSPFFFSPTSNPSPDCVRSVFYVWFTLVHSLSPSADVLQFMPPEALAWRALAASSAHLSPIVFANQSYFPHCSQNVLFKVQTGSCHISSKLYCWLPTVPSMRLFMAYWAFQDAGPVYLPSQLQRSALLFPDPIIQLTDRGSRWFPMLLFSLIPCSLPSLCQAPAATFNPKLRYHCFRKVFSDSQIYS